MRQLLRIFPFALLLVPAACAVQPESESGDAGPQSGSGGSGAGVGGTLGGTGSGTGGAGLTGGSGATAGSSAGGSGNGGSGPTGGSVNGGAGGISGGAGGMAGTTGGSSGAAGSSGAGPGGAGSGGSGGAGAGGMSGKGGSGGASGAGGAAAFDPCPPTGACKILPLGDSITDGVGVSGGGGYRIELFRRALAGGKTITFVGSLMNGPTMVDGQMFPRSHEGHSGWRIDQIDGIVPSNALNPDPHIILLHIGTNDIAQGQASGAPNRLATLIDQIVADLPNSLVVVAKIIPLNTQVTAFNNALPDIVMQRANMGKHVILVDQNMGFPTSELADGVHPNAMGYARMAGVWYAAIQSYLH